jgi:TPR repeat protein
MLRRASRGVIFLTKSRVKNLCENVLSEERFMALYPPPVDQIAQKAEVRAQFQNAVKLLAVAAKNHEKSFSAELKDITSWTMEDVESGSLSTEQLMHLAKLRFNGSPGGEPQQTAAAQQDPELAVAAWVRASKEGNTDASYSVAFCLLNGIGIEQDEEEAFKLMFPLANSYHNAYAHVRFGDATVHSLSFLLPYFLYLLC